MSEPKVEKEDENTELKYTQGKLQQLIRELSETRKELYEAKKKIKQNEQEKSRGTFQVLDGNILMLVLPLNSELVFYKVSDANSIVLTDSLGNAHSERM